jgi:plastocyanin domain-containing protein
MKSNQRVLAVISILAIGGAWSIARAAGDGSKQGNKKVVIAVTEKGFQPNTITVKQGQPVEIVFTRKTKKTCIKEVVLETSDATKIQKKLPLNKPVTIKTTFTAPRHYKYACDMNMFSGTVIVE